MNGLGAATSFEVIGRPKPEVGQEPVTDVRVATHDYFGAMGIRLVRGRLFGAEERSGPARRVIISDSMARKSLGRTRIRSVNAFPCYWNDPGEDEIIGVVGDVRQETLEEEVRPSIYWPPARFAYPWMTVAIRAAGDVGAIVPAVTANVTRSIQTYRSPTFGR